MRRLTVIVLAWPAWVWPVWPVRQPVSSVSDCGSDARTMRDAVRTMYVSGTIW